MRAWPRLSNDSLTTASTTRFLLFFVCVFMVKTKIYLIGCSVSRLTGMISDLVEQQPLTMTGATQPIRYSLTQCSEYLNCHVLGQCSPEDRARRTVASVICQLVYDKSPNWRLCSRVRADIAVSTNTQAVHRSFFRVAQSIEDIGSELLDVEAISKDVKMNQYV